MMGMGGGTTKQSSDTTKDEQQQTVGSNVSHGDTVSQTGVQSGGYGSDTKDTSGQQGPWEASLPYILQGLQGASNLYNNPQQNQFYQGSLYASLTPQQQSAISGLNNYASGGGANIANLMSQMGANVTGNLNSATGAAQDLYSRALSDPTQSNIASAGQYANNPYTAGMIQSAISPIEQQLRETDIPGLNINAVNSGNLDSSRAGVQEALLRRNAGTQEANVASNLLGNQYNSGLQLANSARNSGLGAAQNALGSMTDLGKAGANLLGQGYQTSLNNLNIPLTTGNLGQQDQQKMLDAAYQQWQGQNATPWQNLNNFWNIASKQLGSTNTGTQTGTNTQSNYSNTNTQSATEQAAQNLQNMIDQSQSHTDTATTTPGPGILGSLMGLASGVGSFFAPGGLASSIGGFFK